MEKQKEKELKTILAQIAVVGKRLAEKTQDCPTAQEKKIFWRGIVASAVAEELLTGLENNSEKEKEEK